MCEQKDENVTYVESINANIDSCIAPIVKALNDAGIKTVASCCGHGRVFGNIALADGRELIIMPDYETSRKAYKKLDTRSCSTCTYNGSGMPACLSCENRSSWEAKPDRAQMPELKGDGKSYWIEGGTVN